MQLWVSRMRRRRSRGRSGVDGRSHGEGKVCVCVLSIDVWDGSSHAHLLIHSHKVSFFPLPFYQAPISNLSCVVGACRRLLGLRCDSSKSKREREGDRIGRLHFPSP